MLRAGWTEAGARHRSSERYTEREPLLRLLCGGPARPAAHLCVPSAPGRRPRQRDRCSVLLEAAFRSLVPYEGELECSGFEATLEEAGGGLTRRPASGAPKAARIQTLCAGRRGADSI